MGRTKQKPDHTSGNGFGAVGPVCTPGDQSNRIHDTSLCGGRVSLRRPDCQNGFQLSAFCRMFEHILSRTNPPETRNPQRSDSTTPTRAVIKQLTNLEILTRLPVDIEQFIDIDHHPADANEIYHGRRLRRSRRSAYSISSIKSQPKSRIRL